MRLPTLTGEFRLGGDPELRFTPTGKAVCTLSMIATESRKNESTNEWEDGESTPWIRVTLWDQAAEEAASTYQSGQRVLATGALYVRKYERREGGEGQSIELKWATVAPIPGGKPRSERSTTRYADDPWTTPSTTGNPGQNVPAGNPWGIPGGQPVNRQDEPPF